MNNYFDFKKETKSKKAKTDQNNAQRNPFFPRPALSHFDAEVEKKKKRKKKRKKELVSIQCSAVLLRADAAVSGGTGNLCCLWWCSSTRLDERAKPRILKQPRLFEPPRGRRRNDAASTYQNRRSVLFLFYECRHALQINVYLMHFCSCSFVSVALFYFPLDIEQQIYKSCVGAKAEWNITRRRTMATQYLMSTRQARLTTGRQQLSRKTKKDQDPGGSAVVTFDLREGRSAIRPHQTAATTASAAAGRTRTNRSEVKNEAFVTSPFLISESRAQFINMSI